MLVSAPAVKRSRCLGVHKKVLQLVDVELVFGHGREWLWLSPAYWELLDGRGLEALCEDLRAKMAEADEERDSLRRALREASGRGEELKRLRKEREVLAERFSAIRGMGLRHLPPRDRRAVYEALRMTAHADEKGDVSITGIFDADLTELLPASWVLAKAGAREYDPSLNRRLPTPHKGVVSVGHPRRGT